MKKIAMLLVGVALVGVAAQAHASEGIVVYNSSGCRSRYVVETMSGYAILEWFGGHDPSVGERVVGNFETFGMPTIYSITARSEGKVWVEDFWLGRSRVIEKMQDHCS